VLGSWRAGKLYGGIFTAAVFVVIVGIEWEFGSNGGWIFALTLATIVISLSIFDRCRKKRAQSSAAKSRGPSG
jgi:type IV secretory pathway VirB2 component (pilin)